MVLTSLCTANRLCSRPAQVQKLTDRFVADIDKLGDAKEKELNKLLV